jgi:uncharacterized protein (DUF362 family)
MTPSPAHNEATDRAVVALERADSYDPAVVGPAIERAVAAVAGWDARIRRGDRVLVKPNCISNVPASRPAQTHPAVILQVCRQLLDFGARPFVGDSPAWGSLPGNLRLLGILDELARLGVPVVEFKHSLKAPNPRGKVFHRLAVASAAIEADAIVNLPKLKTHRQLLMTVALKNMFGCVAGRRKAWWHVKAGSYDNYFSRMLVETYELLRPAVNIIDAVVAMEGPGPIKGRPRAINLVMASTDGPALERVTAEIVGVKPGRLRTLAAARELGVGTPYLDRIDVVGVPLSDARLADFALPSLLPIGFSFPRLVKGAFKNAWITRQQSRAQEPDSRPA